MEIKINCICDTRFAFEIEPEDGRMPMQLDCPNCGADCTEQANEFIAQHSTPTNLVPTVPAGPVRVSLSGVKAAAPTQEAPATDVPMCNKHKLTPAASECFYCQKAICTECLEAFGYFCSVYCQHQARERGMQAPVYEFQRSVQRKREWGRMNQIISCIGAAFVLFIVAWGWYEFSGSKPSVALKMPFETKNGVGSARLLSTDDLMILDGTKVTRYSLKADKEQWAIKLPGAAPKAAPKSAGVFDFDDEPAYGGGGETAWQLAGTDVWLAVPGNLHRLDFGNGTVKSSVALPTPVEQLELNDKSLLAIADSEGTQKTLSRVNLADGKLTSETWTDRQAPPPGRATNLPNAPERIPTAMSGAFGEDAGNDTPPTADRQEILTAGANIVTFDVKMKDVNFTLVEAMKPAKTSGSVLDNGVSAANSMAMVGDLMNEMGREGGAGHRFVDWSRYRVSLRRQLPMDGPEWNGEVTGPPAFFPLQTVDVLFAGTNVHVFNKRNVKLWESKLSFPIIESLGLGRREVTPCFEAGGLLYCFDQGTLTAFELGTGKVRWRFTSVGISSVVRDDKGMLYVCSTTASPESIQYKNQVDLGNREEPLLLKVHPATGKVIWQVEGLGSKCYFSNGFLYATREASSIFEAAGSALSRRPMITYFQLFRVNPSSGKRMWETMRPSPPNFVEVQANRILLQYNNSVEVLKFFSL